MTCDVVIVEGAMSEIGSTGLVRGSLASDAIDEPHSRPRSPEPIPIGGLASGSLGRRAERGDDAERSDPGGGEMG